MAGLSDLTWLDRYFVGISEVVTAFVQPAVGATLSVTFDSTTWVVPGAILFIEGGGYYDIVAVSTDGVTVTVSNRGENANSVPGTVIRVGADAAPSGPPGPTSPVAYLANVTHTVGPSYPTSLSPQKITVAFDSFAGPISLPLPSSPVGTEVRFIDGSQATAALSAVTFTDPHNYPIQDPDNPTTFYTNASPGGGYAITAPRNLEWTLVKCTRTNTTFWAAT